MSKASDVKSVRRPCSESSRLAILEATWTLLKTTTLRDLSIEAIARESGVGITDQGVWGGVRLDCGPNYCGGAGLSRDLGELSRSLSPCPTRSSQGRYPVGD
jgi:hypothetical protein